MAEKEKKKRSRAPKSGGRDGNKDGNKSGNSKQATPDPKQGRPDAKAKRVTNKGVSESSNGGEPRPQDGSKKGSTYIGELKKKTIPELHDIAREDKVEDVIFHFFIDIDLVHELAKVHDLIDIQHGVDLDRFADRHTLQDLFLLFFAGITDDKLQHESVNLGFRKRVSPLLFDGVLGGEDEEWDR